MGRPSVPEDETPEGAFIRLANIRADTAIKSIQLLGKLTGKNYASTASQHEKLVEVLTGEIETMHGALSGTATKAARAGIL